MEQEVLQKKAVSKPTEKEKPSLPKIVPPTEDDNIPDTGYHYVLTDVSKERYEPKVEEELNEAQGKLNIIKKRISNDIDFYKKERKKNKLRAFIIRVMSTFLAAIITVLLGLHLEGLEKTFNTIALVISGFLTIIGILQKMLDSKDLWVQYTATVAKLEGLLFSIEYLEEGKNAIRLKDAEYVKLKYDKIMQQTTAFVIKVRSDTGDE